MYITHKSSYASHTIRKLTQRKSLKKLFPLFKDSHLDELMSANHTYLFWISDNYANRSERNYFFWSKPIPHF